MDRQSFSNLKRILLALLVLEAVWTIVGMALKSMDNFFISLFVYIVICGIELVIVVEEHFTMVAIFIVFKVVGLVIRLVFTVLTIIAIAASSSSAGILYGYIAGGVFTLLFYLLVLGLMVAFFVNRQVVTGGNVATQSGYFVAQPNTRPINSFGTTAQVVYDARPGNVQIYP